jgi:hypothetical protein
MVVPSGSLTNSAWLTWKSMAPQHVDPGLLEVFLDFDG